MKTPKNVQERKPKMFENLKNPERCSVTSSLAYEQQRPPEIMDFDSPFYLAFDIEVPKAGKKKPPSAGSGLNSLISIVRNMTAASQLHSD